MISIHPANMDVCRIIDLYRNLATRETCYTPRTEMPNATRNYLINWISFVQSKLKMDDEIAIRAIAIWDYYLSKTHVERNKFTIVALASLLIASKYEDDLYPPICLFLGAANFLCEGEYPHFNEEELFAHERKIIDAIGWNVSFPVATDFLSICFDAVNLGGEGRRIALFVLWCCCTRNTVIGKYKLHVVAQSIMYVVLAFGEEFDIPRWVDVDINIECIQEIISCIRDSGNYCDIRARFNGRVVNKFIEVVNDNSGF